MQRLLYLQGKLLPIYAVFGTVRGGIAQAPVECDASHLKPGLQTPSTHIEVSSHINCH